MAVQEYQYEIDPTQYLAAKKYYTQWGEEWKAGGHGRDEGTSAMKYADWYAQESPKYSGITDPNVWQRFYSWAYPEQYIPTEQGIKYETLGDKDWREQVGEKERRVPQLSDMLARLDTEFGKMRPIMPSGGEQLIGGNLALANLTPTSRDSDLGGDYADELGGPLSKLLREYIGKEGQLFL